MATIGALQPYHGNDWLRHMQPISNHDKHNDLVIVAHAARVQLRDEPFDSLSRRGRMESKAGACLPYSRPCPYGQPSLGRTLESERRALFAHPDRDENATDITFWSRFDSIRVERGKTVMLGR